MRYLRKTKPSYLLVPMLILCCFTFNVAAQNNQLFELLPESQLKQSKSQLLNGKGTYPIQINRKMSALNVGDLIDLPLPNGSTLQLKIDKKWIAGNGDIQMTGQFDESGSAVITFGDDSVFANFSSEVHRYGIGLDENRQSFLIDHKVSDNRVDLGDDMVMPEDNAIKKNTSALSQPIVAQGSAGNKDIITLLVVYSPEFGTAFANPVTRINQMIAFTNLAYDRSSVYIELQLAHSQSISFNNSANPSTLLNQARNGTNAFTGLHALRDQYYADMVAVLPFSAANSISGIAYVNGTSAANAYSVSQFAAFGSDSLFAHELGHNLGSGHERVSANPGQSSPCGGGATGYACGHGNGTQGTIMSYLNDAAWGFVFSNPTLDCNGEPCGIAQGQANAADNRTSFNITGPLIEAFRIDTTDDDDKDGVKNNVDNCPNNANSNQLDTDSDNQGDVCDSDDDGDGINDVIDNCRLISNPLQEDADSNGQGDACQRDDLCFPVKSSNEKIAVVCL